MHRGIILLLSVEAVSVGVAPTQLMLLTL